MPHKETCGTMARKPTTSAKKSKNNNKVSPSGGDRGELLTFIEALVVATTRLV